MLWQLGTIISETPVEKSEIYAFRLSALIHNFGDVFFISTTISYKLKSKSLKFEVPKVS